MRKGILCPPEATSTVHKEKKNKEFTHVTFTVPS